MLNGHNEKFYVIKTSPTYKLKLINIEKKMGVDDNYTNKTESMLERKYSMHEHQTLIDLIQVLKSRDKRML